MALDWPIRLQKDCCSQGFYEPELVSNGNREKGPSLSTGLRAQRGLAALVWRSATAGSELSSMSPETMPRGLHCLRQKKCIICLMYDFQSLHIVYHIQEYM